jgi:hypothetical protein
MEKSHSYILEHFVHVAVDNKHLLELNIDDFFGIINDEMLNVKVWEKFEENSNENFHVFLIRFQDEYVVWECILRWIDYCPDERLGYLTKLMRACRLGLLSNTVSTLKFVWVICKLCHAFFTPFPLWHSVLNFTYIL